MAAVFGNESSLPMEYLKDFLLLMISPKEEAVTHFPGFIFSLFSSMLYYTQRSSSSFVGVSSRDVATHPGSHIPWQAYYRMKNLVRSLLQKGHDVLKALLESRETVPNHTSGKIKLRNTTSI